MIENVFSSAEFDVFYQPAKGEVLLVTFAPLEFDAKIDVFWGRYFAEKAGFPALGFVPRRSTWYPERDMLAAACALAGLLERFQARITYGSSMGAYGAVKYGKLLGAAASAAFGPQVSINPADGVSSQAYTRYYRADLHSDMIIKKQDVCPNSFVFFDPHEPFDRKNALTLKLAVPETTLIRLPFTGHECIKVVAGIANSTAILNACLAGNRVEVESVCKQLRSASPARYAGVANALIASKPGLASEIVRRHGGAFDPKQTASFHDAAANAFANRGQFLEAEKSAKEALSVFPDRISFIRTLGITYEKSGRLELAAASYGRYLVLNPIDLAVHHAQARVYISLGDFGAAERVVMSALTVSQTHIGILHQLSLLHTERGQLSEAISRLDQALRIKPDDTDGLFKVAVLLERSGRFDEAVLALERVVALHPADSIALDRLQRLRLETNRAKTPSSVRKPLC